MAVLTKIKFPYRLKSSTLMETLVATVLIVVIFMIASMILNNLFSGTIKANTRAINSHLNELEYLCTNKVLIMPYNDDFKTWEVSITKSRRGENQHIILLEAINKATRQQITREVIEY